MPSAENGALAEALCHEYHPMHWDVAYGNRNRACEACKIHAASLVASGWRVIPPGQGGQTVTYREPPEGWFTFGTHVDQPVRLEFSDEVGEDLLPLWERPIPPGGET